MPGLREVYDAVTAGCAAVVEQLWYDQPATVWEQARRLSATGLSRQQVLDRLVKDWQRGGGPATGGLEALLGAGSTGSRPAALRALCVPPARGGRG